MILISQFNAVVDRNNLKMNKQAHDSPKTQHDYQDIIDAQRITQKNLIHLDLSIRAA